LKKIRRSSPEENGMAKSWDIAFAKNMVMKVNYFHLFKAVHIR
jgi:hypothetical protein